MKSETKEQAEGGAGMSDPFAVDLFADGRRDASRQESPALDEVADAGGDFARPWHESLPRVTRDEARLSKALSTLPHALSNEARAAVARVLANFARVEENEVGLDLIDLRESDAEEFASSPSQSPRLFANLSVEPDGAPVAVALDSVFACSIVDRVLGGDGSPPDALREPSHTERAVVEFLCLRVLHELNALAGEPLFRLESLSPSSALVPTTGAGSASSISSRTLVATVRVAGAGPAGLARVALTEASLAALGASESRLLLNGRKGQKGAAERWKAWRRLASDAPLRLRVGETRASVGDVEGLERGDIVVVERVHVARDGARFAGRVRVLAGAGQGVSMDGRVAESGGDEEAGARTLAVLVEGINRGAGAEATERIKMENEELRDGEAGAALEGLLLTLHVELPARRISLEELSRLRAGQVLELGCRPTDPVELVADGRRVAVGELVDVEGRLGVRVTRLVG
ncbi:MAG TPA: FliM/FliN family flagellar motor switch protein [Pyrinomonadaceae bacterium]|jgi:type III secretion protein Q|nr:FliM/FliN family flagellar motor switch protein [Pyrinomonadaceae bacterium]